MVCQLALEARGVGALGEPEAPAPFAEATRRGPPCRWPAAGACRRRWRAGAAARAWPRRSTAPRRRGRRRPRAGHGRALRSARPPPRSRPPRGAPRPRARARPARSSPAELGSCTWPPGSRAGSPGSARQRRRAWPRAGRTARGSGRPSPGRRRARPGAAGRRRPPPPRATPRRTARCRSPPRRACASGARAPARPDGAALMPASGSVRVPRRAARARRRRSWPGPTTIAGSGAIAEHGDSVEGGMDGDHGEQRAGALVDQARARRPTAAITGRMTALSSPWK